MSYQSEGYWNWLDRLIGDGRVWVKPSLIDSTTGEPGEDRHFTHQGREVAGWATNGDMMKLFDADGNEIDEVTDVPTWAEQTMIDLLRDAEAKALRLSAERVNNPTSMALVEAITEAKRLLEILLLHEDDL